MLAFTPSSSPHAFLPAIPSPLSPRSANIYGPPTCAMNNESQDQKPKDPLTFDRSSLPATDNGRMYFNAPASRHVPFSQRSIKRAPSPKQDELKDRRRNAFLRKVQSNREDKRYESRGEDIQRLEFVRLQRQEREELARIAPSPSQEEFEEEYDLPGWSQMGTVPEEQEADEFVRDEEAEMQALLEYTPVEQDQDMETQQSDGSENLWSDGADYDELFSEVLRSEEGENVRPSQQGGEEMDMS